MQPLKLPNLYKFRGNKKEDPYSKFYSWVISQTYPNGLPEKAKINVSNVCISIEDEDILKSMCMKWIKKHKGWNTKKSAEALAWHRLQFGPRVSEIENSGYAYIDDNFLIIV